MPDRPPAAGSTGALVEDPAAVELRMTRQGRSSAAMVCGAPGVDVVHSPWWSVKGGPRQFIVMWLNSRWSEPRYRYVLIAPSSGRCRHGSFGGADGLATEDA